MLSNVLILLLHWLRGWLVSYDIANVEISIELCRLFCVLPTLGRPRQVSCLNLLSCPCVEPSSLGSCPWIV